MSRVNDGLRLLQSLDRLDAFTLGRVCSEARVLPGDLADVVRETVEALESLDEPKTLDLKDGDDYFMTVNTLESIGDMDERDIMGLVKAALKGASESLTGDIEGFNDVMRDVEIPLRVLHLDEIKAIGNHLDSYCSSLDRVDHEDEVKAMDDLNDIIKEVLT